MSVGSVAGTVRVSPLRAMRPRMVTGLRSDARILPIRLRGGSETQSAVDDAINSMRSQALDAGKQNEHVLDALKLMVMTSISPART